MMKIAVVGMGYVGIPAAALLADVEGFEVVGIQRRSKRSGWKIEALNEGKCPIGGDEPGLQELIKRVVIEKKTFRVEDSVSAVSDCDAVLLDVQTPVEKDHEPRYESLKEVSRGVGEQMRRGTLVVVESTVAPGTTDHMVKPILEEASGMRAGEDFYLAFSYERVMVGRLINNIVNYPRVVGGIDEESTRRALELYKTIVKAELILADALTAEVAKVVENTYRDVNIAFSNEVAIICDSLGIDVYDVRRMVNSLPNDPSNPAANPVRNFHFPGAGVGGHCLPKDPWLLKYGQDNYGGFSFEPRVIMESRHRNDAMPEYMAQLVETELKKAGKTMVGSKVCILGLAFLENSDDTRNTPAADIFAALKKRGAEVMIHDPFVWEFPDVVATENLEEAAAGADCILVATAHKQYVDMDLARLKELVRTPILVDGRNTFTRERAEGAGFSFRALGRTK